MSEAAHRASRPRGIQLTAAGPFRFAGALRACPVGHLAIRLMSQP